MTVPFRANRSMPACSVIPVLAYPDVREAVRWLCTAFGFRERLRIGEHRSQLVFGDGAVVVTQSSDASPASVMVRVEDVEHHRERAVNAGARVVNEPAAFPYGEKQYTVQDIGGHVWTFSETVEDVAPEDWGGATDVPNDTDVRRVQ
ncbi:MAG TPA: VOC family protein [Thermoanaerobaculia bacterium]|jgi:uncharacterized glyoxalase superfamily protein PhnB|nr:VOC family protein [Thermoanaerobaculia bacterium]